MGLDEDCRLFLQRLEQAHVLPPYEMSLAEARAQSLPPGPPYPEMEAIQDTIFESEGHRIGLRVYIPKPRDGVEKGRPVVVYFHGGGWVLGSLPSYDGLCRYLAEESGAIVMSVGYRLAPEHRFPAGMEDCWNGVKWAAANGERYGGDGGRLAVCGDSAGGNLAAVMCLLARDRGEVEIGRQVLLYPITDSRMDSESFRRNGEGYFLTRRTMEWFWKEYLGEEGDRRNPYASPMHAASLRGLPGALVLTAEYDPLRDEGVAFAEKLREDGVEVELVEEKGMIHGYVRRTDVFRRSPETLGKIGSYLRRGFGMVGPDERKVRRLVK